jgi:hypothetical protein
VFLILYPFIDEEVLTSKIFAHNLFEDESLLGQLEKLLGLTAAKPFECVGTVREAQAAFYLSLTKMQREIRPLPRLLKVLTPQVLSGRNDWPDLEEKLLQSRAKNYLPDWAKKLVE